jgi:probable phosphoglycerate mutase
VELLLIRHGETRRAEAGAGPADPGLTEQGHDQAGRLAEWLGAHEHLDHVVTSPLLRARQTAAPLCDRLGVEPEIVIELAEFDAESPSYIPMEEMRATRHPRLRAMVEGRWDELDSEVDPDAFRLTIVRTLDRLALVYPGQQIAAVCHGAVINAYLGDVIGTPRLLWFEPRYTSIHRVLVSRDGVRSVASLNELPHLTPGAPPAG